MYLVCSMHMVCSWYVHVMLLARGLRSFSLPSHPDHVLLSSCRSGPKTPPSTVAQGPSDLLTALSMSYGGGPPRKQEKQGEEKRDQVTHREIELGEYFICSDIKTDHILLLYDWWPVGNLQRSRDLRRSRGRESGPRMLGPLLLNWSKFTNPRLINRKKRYLFARMFSPCWMYHSVNLNKPANFETSYFLFVVKFRKFPRRILFGCKLY